MGGVPRHLLAKLLGAWSRLSAGGVGVRNEASRGQ